MNFSDSEHKSMALNHNQINYDEIHTPCEAFFLLINGFDASDLENLLNAMYNYYLELNPELNITLDDCYEISQNLNLNKTEKDIIYQLAIKCINSGKHLGNRVLPNNINTSSWISHCINAAQACKQLASQTNLDDQIAETLGLLHDYGRKYSHKFNHTILGYEALVDIGWNNEAISCLTHSFLNSGRCSNNEPALQDFFVDEYGNPQWKPNTQKDDLTLFLENYDYSPYDYLLNIADLTATADSIVPPHIRIQDIATRRNIDPTNRAYFLCDLINILIKLLNDSNQNKHNFEYIKALPNISIEEITKYFIEVSNEFYQVFFKKQLGTKKVVK